MAPLRFLVVEDEALLAMDIEAMVEDAGHCVIGGAASFSEAQSLPSAPHPDIAFVDLQLAEGSSGIDVCALIQRRWPRTMIVFITANPKKLPDDYAGAQGVIPKPFSRNGLISAVNYLSEIACAPPPRSPLPASFLPAPTFERWWRRTME